MFSCKSIFQVPKESYVFKEHSIIRLATIYIQHRYPHTCISWFDCMTQLSLDPRFDFTIYSLQVCSFMLFPLLWAPHMWGVRPRIPMAYHMGCTPRGGPAHKTKPCGARLCSVSPARHREDILKILWDLLGYVWSQDSCNLLLLSGYLSYLTDL